MKCSLENKELTKKCPCDNVLIFLQGELTHRESIPMDKKTQRKNQTNLQVNWPSDTEYWTVKDLINKNPQFVAPITLRVRLANAIKKQNTVAVIGDKMNSKGRPEMVMVIRQKDGTIKQSVIDAAKADGIRTNDVPPVVVTNISVSTSSQAPTPSNGQTSAVNLNSTQKAVVV